MNGDNVRAISILRSIRNIALDVGSSIGASKESVIEAMGMAIGSLDRPTPAPGALPELPAIPESLMATLQDAMNQYAHTGGCDIDAVIAAIRAYAEQCRAGVVVTDAQCEAIYQAVSMANLTRDVKSPERKREVVRAALQSAFADDEGVKRG